MRDLLTPWVRWGRLRLWLEGQGVTAYALKQARRECRGVEGHPLSGRVLPMGKRAVYDWRAVGRHFGVGPEARANRPA